MDSYCKKLLQPREGIPFRTECLWSLVKYGDAKGIEGFFEEWGNLDKSEKEEQRYEGIIEWDDSNYEQTEFDEVADNKHLKFVLQRALSSDNFYFIGRLDIHSDIILDYLENKRGIKLFDFDEGFSLDALKFLTSREKSYPIPVQNLCLLNPYWPEHVDSSSSKIECAKTDFVSDSEIFWKTMKADYKAILLRGAKSVGKTTAIKHYLEREVSKKNPVLVLTHRAALAENLAEKLNLNNYRQVPDFESPNALRMALCVNSLINLRHRIGKGDYDQAIVFIDEVMSFLPYIAYGGDEIGMPEIRTCIVKTLKSLFERASKVILADADLTEFVYEFCQNIFGSDKVHVLNIIKEVPYTKPVKLLKHNGGALEHVATELIEESSNIPLIIFSGSKGDTNQIKRLYESTYPEWELRDMENLPEGFHPEVLKVNSGTSGWQMSRKFFENPSQYIQDSKLKLLIATNSIDAGVSIDLQDYFKSVLLGTDSNHISPLVMSQQAFRLRDVNVERVFLVPRRIIIEHIDTKEKRKLTIQANRLHLVDLWANHPQELALLKKSLHNSNNSKYLSIYFGVNDIKKILKIKNSLLDLDVDCPTPYLDLMCTVVDFDRRLKNNFVDALTESLLIDGNTIEQEEITTPEREKPKRELPGTIEEITARTQTATPEDDIDYFIISVNRAFGKDAHKIEELLIAYENEQEKKLKRYVDRAKIIFFKSKETFMIENLYALDADDDYEKLLVLFDWGLNKYGNEIVNGYLSYQSLKQLLEASKPIKDELLKSFTTRQKTLGRVPQVINFIKKVLGLDFKTKKDKKYWLEQNLEAHLILRLWQDM
ncbi:MAG: hypothetical protein WBM44_29115 [Waterburya sp.]